MADLPKQWALTPVKCCWDAILCKELYRVTSERPSGGQCVGQAHVTDECSKGRRYRVTEKVVELRSGWLQDQGCNFRDLPLSSTLSSQPHSGSVFWQGDSRVWKDLNKLILQRCRRSLFFFRWNSYNIKLIVLQWSVQWYLGHLHVVQPSPLSSCKTFSSLPKETLYPVSSHLPFFPSPWPLATTDLLSISIDEHVWIFIWMESYNIWLFISVFTCHKILAVYSSCGM